MNYFNGLRNNIFKSKLQIPLFKNKLFKPSELLLFKCYASNNAWNLNEVKNRKINDYFYIIDGDDITNNDIFFLAAFSTYI